MREARRAFRRVACAMTRASACGSSWLSVESRRVALATIATPSRADAPRRRPVAAVRHAIAAEAPATHWAGRQKARAALASATRLMSESDRASFAAYDVEFVVEISRCRAPLHRSTTQAPRHAADVELYSSTALSSALHLYSSTALYTLHPLHPPSAQLCPPRGIFWPLEFIELSSRKDDSSDAHCDHLPPSHIVAQVHSLFEHLCLHG